MTDKIIARNQWDYGAPNHEECCETKIMGKWEEERIEEGV